MPDRERSAGPVGVPDIDDILADPATNLGLKRTLRAWLERDAVDAARDARLLAEVLERRADGALGIASR